MIRPLLRLAGLLTGVYLSYVALRGSRELVRPMVRAFVPDVEDGPSTPADVGLEFEQVRFTTADGVDLSGWLIPAARETKTTVVVLHGFSGHRLPELASLVPWLQERHNVLQFDFRGHGESGPGSVTLGSLERRDVAAAVEFLRSRDLGPIALFGISMGAAIAIVSAPDLPVRAVVADASFAHLRHPIANRMRQLGYPLARLGSHAIAVGMTLRSRSWLTDPIRAVRRISPRALLLIAPKDDELINWRQSVQLYEAAGEPKELLVVDGAGHAQAYAVSPVEYRARVLAFLERHLG